MKAIITTILLFSHLVVNTQTRYYYRKNTIDQYIGIAAGQETFISGVMPKVGLLVQNFHTKNKKFSTYYGADITLGVFFQFWLSVTAQTGIRYNYISLDNSIGYLGLFPQKLSSKHQFTCNPKLGTKIGPVWLKAGPSILLSHRRALNNFLKIGEYYYNFEILFLINTN
jgi:hypothetical protein